MENKPIIIKRKQADMNVEAVRKVSDLLRTINYGSITLVVQGGKVFQINKIENCKVPLSVSG